MDKEETLETGESDFTPAIPLEISSELAAQVDEILGIFAEDAELDMAMVVDQSGALVTGISSEEEVMVEVISALVAGASGAMRALAGELGETGEIETFHQGETRVVYLSEMVDSFILVGVCTAPTPVGIIREKANQIRSRLVELLEGIEASNPEEIIKERPKLNSLRAIAIERAAAREIKEAAEIQKESPEAASVEPEELEGATAEEPVVEKQEEAAVSDESPREVVEEIVPQREPTEVIEPLGLDEPEIVIEDSGSGNGGEVVDSPFEFDELEEEEGDPVQVNAAPVESIFELEEEEAEEPEEETESKLPEPGAEEQAEAVAETELKDPSSQVSHHIDPREETSANIFEVDEEEETDEEAGPVFELDEEDEEDKEIENEEEESELRSSGPFYF